MSVINGAQNDAWNDAWPMERNKLITKFTETERTLAACGPLAIVTCWLCPHRRLGWLGATTPCGLSCFFWCHGHGIAQQLPPTQSLCGQSHVFTERWHRQGETRDSQALALPRLQYPEQLIAYLKPKKEDITWAGLVTSVSTRTLCCYIDFMKCSLWEVKVTKMRGGRATPFASVFFPVAMTSYPNKVTYEEKGCQLYNSKVSSIMMVESQWQELGGTGHITFTIKSRQQLMNAYILGPPFIFPNLYSPGHPVPEMVLPTLGSILPFLINLVKKICHRLSQRFSLI